MQAKGEHSESNAKQRISVQTTFDIITSRGQETKTLGYAKTQRKGGLGGLVKFSRPDPTKVARV